jgi:hypothetical protein
MSAGQIFDTVLASPVTWGVLAIIAGAVALAGKFSITASDNVLVVAAVLAIVAIFRAPPFSQQDLLVRVLWTSLLGSALSLSLVTLSEWWHPVVQLDFKDSPFFTDQIKRRIRRDITENRDYLTRLGIRLPDQLPPVRVQTGPNAGRSGLYTPPALPNYRWEMVVGENSINDRGAPTEMYDSFVVGQLVFDPKVMAEFGNSVQGIAIPMMLSEAFTTYFNTSFWGQRPVHGMPWTTQLWKIRDELGATFTDRMVAYALMSVYDSPKEGIETKFDPFKNLQLYLYRKLKVGDSVIDNESARWPEVVRILKADGFPTDE